MLDAGREEMLRRIRDAIMFEEGFVEYCRCEIGVVSMEEQWFARPK